MQQDAFTWLRDKCYEIKPDTVLFNADAIEGKDLKAGSRELITANREEQCEMFVDAVHELFPHDPKYYMTYGTPYHVGRDEDWEKVIANKLECTIKGHLFLDINGCVIDMKHKIGTSTVPHGRSTALKKAAMWNLYWAEIQGQPRANIFIRSHAHYFDYTGNAQYLAIITPCLKVLGDIYGVRECEGTIDFGFVEFVIDDDGSYSWMWHVKKYNNIISDKVVKI